VPSRYISASSAHALPFFLSHDCWERTLRASSAVAQPNELPARPPITRYHDVFLANATQTRLQDGLLGAKLSVRMRNPSRFAAGASGAALVALIAVYACSVQRSTSSHGTQQRTTSEVRTAPGTRPPAPSESLQPIADTGALEPHVHSLQAYDLDHPDRKWLLPNALKEVSDVAVLSETEVACVEDERGLVYVYDLSLARVTDTVHFASKGDYEGLAVARSTVFILRSDGKLFELADLKHDTAVRSHDLRLPVSESEGLCFDATRERLLIAPKSRNQELFGKGIRPIFAFDLQQRILQREPAIEISLREIRRFAKRHDLPVPRQMNKHGERHSALRFEPSAIAVHPKSGEVFVLSSSDHLLVSCTSTGTITGYALLDPVLFRQAEGLAFFPNGDLLISNEASGDRATLLLFRCRGNGC